jgi:hypothetical protein
VFVSEDIYKIYNSYREEIKREDEITHQRMITSMTFQGLLMASMGFLISGAWAVPISAGIPEGFPHFRLIVLGIVGLMGALVATFSFVGILATRISIADVKHAFEKMTKVREGETPPRLLIDPRVPQIHGRGIAFKAGNFYTEAVPALFGSLWALYLAAYSVYVMHLPWQGAVVGVVAYCTILLVIRLILVRKSKAERAKIDERIERISVIADTLPE